MEIMSVFERNNLIGNRNPASSVLGKSTKKERTTSRTNDNLDDIYIPGQNMPKIFNRASFNGINQNKEFRPLSINIEGTLFLPKLDVSKTSSTRYEDSHKKQNNDNLITKEIDEVVT